MNHIHYKANINLGERNTSHTAVIELIQGLGQPGLRILEVGCSSGYMGHSLKQQGHHVWGVEPSTVAAAEAAKVLDGVHAGTLADFRHNSADGLFDVVTLADVIEHIADPGEALRQCMALLAPGGCILVSVPNVTHGSVRSMLLAGRWAYQDYGILDRTHLRFFSRSSLIALFSEQALGITALRRTTSASRRVREDGHPDISSHLIDLVEASATDPDVHTFQFVAQLAPQANKAAADAMNQRWLHPELPCAVRPKRQWQSLRDKVRRRLRIALWLVSGV